MPFIMSSELKHIAFIPDGNRRFARERGFAESKGHALGYDQFKKVVRWCKEWGVKELTFWGFSTENWKRSQEEVGFLFNLFTRMLAEDLHELTKEGARIRVIGERKGLPQSLLEAINHAEQSTEFLHDYTLNLLLNYGGHAEMQEAIRRAVNENVDPDTITESVVNKLLWSAQISDIDLTVRTSGEQRLSGFLPWKVAYSELYFSQKYWPEFEKEDLREAIEWYKNRERRFGGNAKA